MPESRGVQQRVRLAVDAMGGDDAPGAIVQGSLEAAAEFPDAEVILVGHEDRLREEIRRHGMAPPNVRIRHASEVIGMGESPVETLRRKTDASVLKAVDLVRQGEADAVLSAGDTGAAVAAGQMRLRLLPGVRKAGIAVTFNTGKGTCTVIDVGANIYAKPSHLYQYALMASIYCACLHGIQNPVVGLLSIGEEQAKGNDLVRETFPLLARGDFRFAGNVEGRDIFAGGVDVVVCDGFVGNVVLKVIEGLSEDILASVRAMAGEGAANGSPPPPFDRLLPMLTRRSDYSEFGGAPLLGVDGLCLICHGRSSAKAIHNAIRKVRDMARLGLNARIQDLIARRPLAEVTA